MASSDEKDKEIKEVVNKMAQLSISTNMINQIQQENLKMYPFVFFNGIKSVKIDYDLTSLSRVETENDPKNLNITYKFDTPITEHFCIVYDLEIDESQDNGNLDKRFEALEKSISTLFWNGIFVEVNFNGKNVHKSVKNV